MVNNVVVYDLENCIKASKYPKAISTEDCNCDITKTVKNLASCPKGSGHDQFLTGIIVNFDLSCSNKMWVEMQRYHFVEFVSSQSTMHKIANFDIDKQCNQYVDPTVIGVLRNLQKIYSRDPSDENFLKLVYNVPSGFILTARMTTNYRSLKTIYSQRRFHRLPEWREFCKFIETLPYSKELIIGGCDGESDR